MAHLATFLPELTQTIAVLAVAAIAYLPLKRAVARRDEGVQQVVLGLLLGAAVLLTASIPQRPDGFLNESGAVAETQPFKSVVGHNSSAGSDRPEIRAGAPEP